MKKRRFKNPWLVFLAVLLVISSCSETNVLRERARRTSRGKGAILIGAVAPWSEETEVSMLWDGIEMAVGEINAKGGVLGRNISIVKEDDESSVSKGRVIAQRLADNTDIMAVIGHYDSYVSIPASRIYEFSGVVMMSPTSTSPRLTRHGFRYVFRNIANDEQIGRQMADFAAKSGLKRVVIYYVKNEYGKGLANAFEERAAEINMAIVDRLSYDGISTREFRMALTKWKDFKFDAIFLAGTVPHAARFIVQARKMNVTVPIFGGDGLDSPQLCEIGGESAEGTVIASHFHPDIPHAEVRHFTGAFREKYGREPGVWTAQGYDAVRLLAYAVEKAGTTVPRKVAEALHTAKDLPGIAGDYTFDENGDVVGRTIVKKQVRNGRFEYLPEVP